MNIGNKTDGEKPSGDRHKAMYAGAPEPDQNIAWFRQASPYINAHRDKTFVLCISGHALETEYFPTLIHDITLLQSLGVKLVLVHGLRTQLDRRVQDNGDTAQFHNGLRISDKKLMKLLVEEVGKARVLVESRLSRGLPNSPLPGRHTSVASGNFVTAQPFGVVDGIDHCHTGLVRQIHANAIRRQIDHQQLVLLSPIGYSRTGEVFNLEASDVALHTAVALSAEKLVYITGQRLSDANQLPIAQINHSELERYLADNEKSSGLSYDTRMLAEKAVRACRGGVTRVHFLLENDPDALLRELYTRDGFGSMINADTYETLRPASIQDVGGILELIRPLENDGTLVRRSREQLELDIEKFSVLERDGMVVACGALLPAGATAGSHSSDNGFAEIACLVTHPDYRNGGRAETLLTKLENSAVTLGISQVYVLTTRTNHWFLEHGFHDADASQIPESRRKSLNLQRNSKILLKSLQQTQP